MNHSFLLILKTDFKKFLYDFNRYKISFFIRLILKIFLIFILFQVGSIITIPSELYFLLFILIIDWLFKYFITNIKYININLLLTMVKKKYISIYSINKLIFTLNNIYAPFIFLGYGEIYLFIISLFISIFNSFSVFIIKYFNKWNIIFPVSLYFFIYLFSEYTGYIQFVILALIICVINIYISYIIIYKNLNTEWGSRNNVLNRLSLKINRLFYTLCFNEFLLFIRNKRTRIFFVQGFLLFLVGLLYLYDDKLTQPLYLIDISLLFTGAYLLTFWQFFIALDSSYFPFLLTNTTLNKFLNDKVNFMYIVLTINFLICFSISIIYFQDKYLYVLASYLYNIGINIKIMLLFGFYNKSRVELNKSPLMNYEGINRFQFVAPVALFLTSSFVFMVLFLVFKVRYALFGMCLLGVIGLLFNKSFLLYSSRKLNKVKYKLLVSFNARF